MEGLCDIKHRSIKEVDHISRFSSLQAKLLCYEIPDNPHQISIHIYYLFKRQKLMKHGACGHYYYKLVFSQCFDSTNSEGLKVLETRSNILKYVYQHNCICQLHV